MVVLFTVLYAWNIFAIFVLSFRYRLWECLCLVVLVPSFLLLLYHAQDYILYYPNQPSNARTQIRTPDLYDLPFEHVYMMTSDEVQLHAFFIGQPDHLRHVAPTLIFLHGNAGNIGHRLGNAKLLYDELQTNLLLVEYRGYGSSNGTVSEAGNVTCMCVCLHLDLLTSLSFLPKRIYMLTHVICNMCIDMQFHYMSYIYMNSLLIFITI